MAAGVAVPDAVLDGTKAGFKSFENEENRETEASPEIPPLFKPEFEIPADAVGT